MNEKKKSPDYRPRLSVEITTEQQKILQLYLDFGMQKKLFGIIVDDVIEMIVANPVEFLAAVTVRALKYRDFTSLPVSKEK